MKRLKFKRNLTLISGLLLASLLFVILALVDTSKGLLSFDLQSTRALQSFHYPFITKAMIIISWLGYSPQSYIVVAFSSIVLWDAHLRWEAIVSAISSLCTQVLNQLVKLVVHHPRPAADQVYVFLPLKDYSFPSGHVMFYSVYFGFIWYLLFTLIRPLMGPHSIAGFIEYPGRICRCLPRFSGWALGQWRDWWLHPQRHNADSFYSVL